MEARTGEAFVGRVHELAALERALDAARSGSGSAAVVRGEAGIGKTRLAAELARRAGDVGFEVLVGRALDLVGTELPYQPFADALRAHGPLRLAARTQLRVFEQTLALVAERAADAPVLLVLEDVHWADVSTLDLVVFLAHNLHDRRVLLLATCRADEPASTERMHRLAGAVARAESALVLELGPLARDEVLQLLAIRADATPAEAFADAIAARSEGNPFFAEELLAAAHDGDLPRGLRDLLLQRTARLDARTQGLLRLAAVAGREVGYALLHGAAGLPELEVRESLRQAVEHGVLVGDQATGSFRFRHALLGEAIYATVLPGEREELHGRLAAELARTGAASPAELAPHWEAAGRHAEAFAASLDAAHEAEAVCGLAEAHAHLERALALWEHVAGVERPPGLDLAELCTWAAARASDVGAAPRAIELVRRAIELVGADDLRRLAFLHVRLGEYLYETGSNDDALAALEHAVELVPAEPSRERAFALASLAGGLMVAWRHAESLPVATEGLTLARDVGAGEAEVRALTVLGNDHVYLGRAEEGLTYFRAALQLAEEIDDRLGLERVYVNLTDALTMLGRPRESARVGRTGLEAVRRFGLVGAVLVANQIEALTVVGAWDEADTLSAAAVRAITSSFPYHLLMLRALVETGRGDFAAAHAHLESAQSTLRPDRARGLYDTWAAELALWERRWAHADAAIDEALAQSRPREAAQVRVQVCATGLRVQAELAALARARHDADGLRRRLRRARAMLATARRAAADVSATAPNAAGWLALAEAEHERVRGASPPEAWSDAAVRWEQLERAPLVAYCRWREAEALVAAGASRTEAGVPLREAHAIATRIGAKPLAQEVELLAQRARLDLSAADARTAAAERGLETLLGLTPREAEVLTLVARGYTNREIAQALVISVKTASVHVSHILRKLDAPNRLEAAAITHRLSPPPAGPPA